MKLNIFRSGDFTRKLKEVTENRPFQNGKLARNGLFSEQIFGPVKSYHCACNRSTFRGTNYPKKRCPKCGVEITSEDKRSKVFAKICLPFRVMNPVIFTMVCMFRPSMKAVLENLLYYNRYYLKDEEGKLIAIKNLGDYLRDGGEEISEDVSEKDLIEKFQDDESLYMGLDGAKRLVEELANEHKDHHIMKFVHENMDLLTIGEIVVIPPAFRPFTKTGKTEIYDEINQKYIAILTSCMRIKGNNYQLRTQDDLFRSSFRFLQNQVFDLYNFVLSKLSKKNGIIRQNILGKRVDFSGRAVIAPDPNLRLNECSIPYVMALELFRIHFSMYLVKTRHCRVPQDADRLIDECINKRDFQLFDILQKFCKNKVCIINRQPTLHRLSVLGFRIKINKENTIKIPPMAVVPFNADFDGDAMALYIPITEHAERDVIDKIGIWKNLLSPTDISLVAKPNQDIVLGIYSATRNDAGEKKEFKGTSLSPGRLLFNSCLPSDYPVVDEVVDKGVLMGILDDIALKYNSSEVIKVLDKIKTLGFTLSSFEGYTLTLDDVYSEKLIAKARNLGNDFHENMGIINGDPEIKKEIENMPFYDYIRSGARGSIEQVKQLVFCRGYVADSNNEIRDNLIKNSLVSGLSPHDYFESSWGCRKGLLDTACSTGDSGYLTRQLIYSTNFVELAEDVEDCGTEESMSILIDYPNDPPAKRKKKIEKLINSLLWRYRVLDDGSLSMISKKNRHELVGKTIRVRSPFYCECEKGICKKCYGNLHNILHSNQIGMIATQAIGETATQLVLRTFHLSGVAQYTKTEKSEEAKSHKNEDIITGMSVVNKLFHSPDKIMKKKLHDFLEGETEDERIKSIMEKRFQEEPSDLLRLIYDIFSQYSSIHMVHYETILSAMAWTPDQKLWRTEENRNECEREWTSILKVPSYSSWLVGAAFANVKNKLIDGLVRDRKDERTALSELFRYGKK